MRPLDHVEENEAFERDLFVRRARAVGVPRLGEEGVPTLEDVMRRAGSASTVPAEPRAEQGWARFASSACLAAAAFLCAVRAVPRGYAESDAAEVTEGASVSAVSSADEESSSWVGSDESRSCSIDRSAHAIDAPRSCVAPPSRTTGGSRTEEPLVSVALPQRLACEDEALCRAYP